LVMSTGNMYWPKRMKIQAGVGPTVAPPARVKVSGDRRYALVPTVSTVILFPEWFFRPRRLYTDGSWPYSQSCFRDRRRFTRPWDASISE
jgi:hypothetical protein